MPYQPPAWDPDPLVPNNVVGTDAIDLILSRDVLEAVADPVARLTLDYLIEVGAIVLIAGDGADPDHSGNAVVGAGGDDAICTGVGGDRVFAGDGNDSVDAGDGSDIVFGDDNLSQVGHDILSGGAGDDRLYGFGGNDQMWGGIGNDHLFGSEGDDRLAGGDGDDRIEGEGGDDLLFGGDGNDVVGGGDDDDWLFGNDGDDVLDAGDGDDVVQGGWGNDTIDGGGGDDFLCGYSGADTIAGGTGNDTVNAGGAGDYVYGDQAPAVPKQQPIETVDDGDDRLCGLGGADFLWGQGGNDILDGHNHNDTLDGGSGDDILIGGDGNDRLYGGDGNDTFVFNRSEGATGKDIDNILDWNVGDVIALRGQPPFGINKVQYVAFADDEDGDGGFVLNDVVIALNNGNLIRIHDGAEAWGYVAGGPLFHKATIGGLLDLATISPQVAANLVTASDEYTLPCDVVDDAEAPPEPPCPVVDPFS